MQTMSYLLIVGSPKGSVRDGNNIRGAKVNGKINII